MLADVLVSDFENSNGAFIHSDVLKITVAVMYCSPCFQQKHTAN